MSGPFAVRFAIPFSAMTTLASRLGSVLALVKALGHRREVASMLEMDDRMLKDIGLVRTDVLGALAEPLHHDPSLVLRVRSVDHRARQRALEARLARTDRNA